MIQWICDNTDSFRNETLLLCVPERHMTCDSVGLERCWWCVPGKLQTTAGSGWSSWPDRGSSPWRGWAQRVHRAAHSLRRRWSEPCSNLWTTDPEPRWRSPSEPPRYWPEPQKPAHTHRFSSDFCWQKHSNTPVRTSGRTSVQFRWMLDEMFFSCSGLSWRKELAGAKQRNFRGRLWRNTSQRLPAWVGLLV